MQTRRELLATASILALSETAKANGLLLTRGPMSFPILVSSLTAHNTTASPTYNVANFGQNFGNSPAPHGTNSYTSDTTFFTINQSVQDISLNSSTPGHVSKTNVHTLIPSRPDLRWFAHVLSWWEGTTSGINNVQGQTIFNGTTCNSTGYIQALVTDLQNRGFNGVFLDGGGQGSATDGMAQKIQTYLATIPGNTFTYAVILDQGIIAGLSGAPAQAALDTAVKYLHDTYWSDPNYEKDGGVPLTLFYGMRATIGSSTPMAAVKANYGGYWMDVNDTYIAETWQDGCFDWHDAWTNGVGGGDPYNLATVNSFLSTVAGQPTKHCMGAMTTGVNGTLTGDTTWALGYYLQQDSGKCMMSRAAAINTNIPANVKRMQWVTWNDYMEGSEIETAAENNVTVTASIVSSSVNWTFTSGTGDETVIDHYEVYASPDGVNAADLGSIATGTYTMNLSGRGLTHGSIYSIMVVAVGKPCIRDHMSNSVSYTA